MWNCGIRNCQCKNYRANLTELNRRQPNAKDVYYLTRLFKYNSNLILNIETPVSFNDSVDADLRVREKICTQKFRKTCCYLPTQCLNKARAGTRPWGVRSTYTSKTGIINFWGFWVDCLSAYSRRIYQTLGDAGQLKEPKNHLRNEPQSFRSRPYFLSMTLWLCNGKQK